VHERWGDRAQDAFVLVALAEIVLLVLAWRGRGRLVAIASAVLCVPAVFCLYEAGEHGGDLVYSYAGGPGLRTGKPEDVSRLFIAGIYNQAQADRKAGRPQDAAAEIAAAAARFPSDPNVQLMAAESALLDRKDPAAALDLLGKITIPQADARLRVRHGLMTADALEAAGRSDAAKATLQQLAAAFPENGRVKQRLAQGTPAPR
jgi:tetratricopeptide (TPR) repeat protein